MALGLQTFQIGVGKGDDVPDGRGGVALASGVLGENAADGSPSSFPYAEGNHADHIVGDEEREVPAKPREFLGQSQVPGDAAVGILRRHAVAVAMCEADELAAVDPLDSQGVTQGQLS